MQTPGLTVLDKLEHTITLALQLKFHGSRSQLTIFQGGSMGKEKDIFGGMLCNSRLWTPLKILWHTIEKIMEFKPPGLHRHLSPGSLPLWPISLFPLWDLWTCCLPFLKCSFHYSQNFLSGEFLLPFKHQLKASLFFREWFTWPPLHKPQSK